MKFHDFSPIFWSLFKIPDFSEQFSNFLTFLGFPGSVTTLFHGFAVIEHWTYCGSNPKTQWILEILRHRKPYFLIQSFFGNISDYYFLKISRRKIQVFPSPQKTENFRNFLRVIRRSWHLCIFNLTVCTHFKSVPDLFCSNFAC